MKKLKLYLILLLSIWLLTGCNNQLAVRHTELAKLIPVFKEYVNLYGYSLQYQNDQTGAYRLYLGEVYVPERLTSTAQETETYSSGNYTNEIMTRYENKVLDTIHQDSRYVKLYAMVRLVQSGSDVLIYIDSEGSGYFQPITSPGRILQRYLQSLGYTVEEF